MELISKGLSVVFLWLIRFYQLTFSFFLGRSCRYDPSCSAYMAEAIRNYGPGQGIKMGLYRLARCHPWGGAGYDPVPPPCFPLSEKPPSSKD